MEHFKEGNVGIGTLEDLEIISNIIINQNGVISYN